MTIKKIKLEAHSKCPKCEGTSGIKFFKPAKVECHNSWGNPVAESERVDLKTNEGVNKTAVCRDCGQRFYIE